MDDEQILSQLKILFKSYPQIIVAYFYGSQVKGYAGKNSDLDLALVVDEPVKLDYGEMYSKINQIVKDIEVDLRIINQQSSPTFIFQVIKPGRCIYQRSDKEKVEFEAKALSDYYDSQHIRDIYDHYVHNYFKGV